MLKMISLILALAIMAGCVLKPSAHDMFEADYGQVPIHYKQMITTQINKSLADPESTRIEVPNPYPAVRQLKISKGGGFEYGQIVHVWVSHKNSLSQYSKKSPRIYWWSNTGWSTVLPSLEGVIPKYPEQAEEYSRVQFTSN